MNKCVIYVCRSTSRTKEKLNKIHMYWMETVTRGLPPCIMIQGNTIQTVTASAWIRITYFCHYLKVYNVLFCVENVMKCTYTTLLALSGVWFLFYLCVKIIIIIANRLIIVSESRQCILCRSSYNLCIVYSILLY